LADQHAWSHGIGKMRHCSYQAQGLGLESRGLFGGAVLSPFAVVVTRLTTTREGGAKALLQGLTVPEPRLFQKKSS
jgi:hypothetical protein